MVARQKGLRDVVSLSIVEEGVSSDEDAEGFNEKQAQENEIDFQASIVLAGHSSGYFNRGNDSMPSLASVHAESLTSAVLGSHSSGFFSRDNDSFASADLSFNSSSCLNSNSSMTKGRTKNFVFEIDNAAGSSDVDCLAPMMSPIMSKQKSRDRQALRWGGSSTAQNRNGGGKVTVKNSQESLPSCPKRTDASTDMPPVPVPRPGAPLRSFSEVITKAPPLTPQLERRSSLDQMPFAPRRRNSLQPKS